MYPQISQITQKQICVICGLLLSVDAVAIVTADGGIIAEATGLRSLRRIDVKPAGAHAVEKLPDPFYDFAANALPVVIGEHGILRAQAQVVELARAIQTFIPPVLRAANHVVTTTCD